MPTYVPNGLAVDGVRTSGVTTLTPDAPPPTVTPIPDADVPAVESPEPVTHAGAVLRAGQDVAARVGAAQTPIPNAAVAISEPTERR